MGCEFRTLGDGFGGWSWWGQGVLGKVLGRVDGGDMVGGEGTSLGSREGSVGRAEQRSV